VVWCGVVWRCAVWCGCGTAYDADGDGTVSLSEVMRFVSKANDEASETIEFATEVRRSLPFFVSSSFGGSHIGVRLVYQQLLATMDRDMNGQLSRFALFRDENMRVVTHDMRLL